MFWNHRGWGRRAEAAGDQSSGARSLKLGCELSVPGLLSQGQPKGGHPSLAGSEGADFREVANSATEQQQDSVGPENSLRLSLASSHLAPLKKKRHFKKC